jgi:hypothetical protein
MLPKHKNIKYRTLYTYVIEKSALLYVFARTSQIIFTRLDRHYYFNYYYYLFAFLMFPLRALTVLADYREATPIIVS